MSCPLYYKANVSQCDDFKIIAALPPSFPLYYIIRKTGSSQTYQKLTNTDVNGVLEIFKADLPAGFLIPGRIFEIELRTGAEYLQQIVFVFGTKQYKTIIAEIVSIEKSLIDISPVDTIQEVTSASFAIPFVNQTVINYTHNFNRAAAVTAFTLSGESIPATIDNSDLNTVVVTLSSPATGRIIIQ